MLKKPLQPCLLIFYAHNLQIHYNIYTVWSGSLMCVLCYAKAGRPSEKETMIPQEKTISCCYSVKSCLIVLYTSSPPAGEDSYSPEACKKITSCCWMLEVVEMIYSIQPYDSFPCCRAFLHDMEIHFWFSASRNIPVNFKREGFHTYCFCNAQKDMQLNLIW